MFRTTSGYIPHHFWLCSGIQPDGVRNSTRSGSEYIQKWSGIQPGYTDCVPNHPLVVFPITLYVFQTTFAVFQTTLAIFSTPGCIIDQLWLYSSPLLTVFSILATFRNISWQGKVVDLIYIFLQTVISSTFIYYEPLSLVYESLGDTVIHFKSTMSHFSILWETMSHFEPP